MPAFIQRLPGVDDQVHDDLLQAVQIGFDGRQIRGHELLDPYVVNFKLASHHRENVLHRLVGIHVLMALSSVFTGKISDVLNDLRHPQHLTRDHLQIIKKFLLIEEPSFISSKKQSIRDHPDRIQRLIQFVRYPRGHGP